MSIDVPSHIYVYIDTNIYAHTHTCLYTDTHVGTTQKCCFG